MKRLSVLIVSFFFWGVLPVRAVDSNVTESKPIAVDKKALLKELDSLQNPFVSKLPMPKQALLPPREDLGEFAEPEETISAEIPEAEIPPPDMVISGLVWNTSSPQAIVNEKIMRVGDKIEEWTISQIRATGIEVNLNGVKHFVKADFDDNKK